MDEERAVAAASEIFKALSSPSRLNILRLLAKEPAGVSRLAGQTGLSQPLVSQHLRTLRTGGLVTVTRSGRESVYEIADHHIVHLVEDAIVHVLEGVR